MNGGIIGAVNTPTLASATGVWDIEELKLAQQQGTWPLYKQPDPDFEYVSLLLSSETAATNGAQNNTFLDSSTNNFTVTRNGNTTQGSFSPFSQTGWSNYFDGTGDYLSAASDAAFSMGTGTYTVELWVYLTTSQPTGVFFSVVNGLQFSTNVTNNIAIAEQGVAFDLSSTTPVPLNQWVHLAVSRDSGNTTRIFLNGAEIASGIITKNYGQGIAYINYNAAAPTAHHTGYYSNVRVVKGTAVYTANFTPPTAPLTAISGTSLLTCQSNRFIDNSSNAFAITRNGDVSVQAFSPFNPTAAWSASTNGGSGYFDGTGDYLQTTSSEFAFGTGDFTIELWFYVNSVSNNGLLHLASSYFPASVSGVAIYIASNNISMYCANTPSAPGGVINTNTWNHVAVVRASGVTRLYLNGTFSSAIGAVTDTTNYTGTFLVIGGYYNNTLLTNGYISNFRIVKGTAVYTSNFTPPTSPLTAIAGTSLLTCQSNRFVDASTNNFTITINGDTRITPFSPFSSFAATKGYVPATYGGSGYFDGTGDYLIVPTADIFNVGTGDFTIECWMYIISSPTYAAIFDTRSTSGLLNTVCGVINTAGVQNLDFVYAGARLTGSINISTSQWCHLAITRTSGVIRLFVNGIQDGSVTYTTSIVPNGTNTWVGAGGKGGSPVYFNGSISDLRIIKGQSLYTSNFVPPTAPLASITNTSLLTNFTNGGIIDSAALNVVETVGNAQVSTSVKKYGLGSYYFDGTGDWCTIVDKPELRFGTDAFTVDFWLYLGATGAARGIIGKGTASTGWLISTNSSNNVVFTYGSSTITSTAALSGSTWYFITVVRQSTGSNQTKIYINGINDGTGTVSTDFNQTAIMYVGANRTGGDALNGYISDLRLTNGLARYTADFTPPGASLPTF